MRRECTGVNGTQSDNIGTDAGAACVFVRSGVTLRQQAYLKASNGDAGDRLGFSVAILGDTLVVGAPHNASGVNAAMGSGTSSSSGTACQAGAQSLTSV
jgi:hypothetical protein